MDIKFFEDHFRVSVHSDLKNFSEVSTDTRSLKAGALFIPLRGENFNGDLFAEKALELGAAVSLVSDRSIFESLEKKYKKRIVYVEDALKSFQSLAKSWQNEVAPKVIAITGSNGKTTSKFFTAQMLESFFKVCYSPKSFNNEVGVPVTQALLKKDDEVLIAEVGTNAKGEIQELTKLIEPEICVVTTVGASHLEGFGTVDNVAAEKSEIYKSEKIKVGIFNLDNKWTKKMFEDFKGEKIGFSTLDEKADVFLKPKQVDVDELKLTGHVLEYPVDVTCKVFGEHNAYNIMTALSVGLALEVSPQRLIEKIGDVETPWGRSQILETPYGAKLLFDGYNSNMQSMGALFDGVAPLIESGQKLHFILGEMLELGESTAAMHRELGLKAGALKPESILFIGPSSRHFEEGVRATKFSNSLVISRAYDESLAIDIRNVLDPKSTVVVKGSRGMKLERFFEAFGLKSVV